MSVDTRGAVLVLDDGTENVPELLSRARAVFPYVHRLTAQSPPEPDEHDIVVGRKHLNTKTLVRQMHKQSAHWGVVPNTIDPVVLVADYLSAARPLLEDGYAGFVLIAGRPHATYRRIAMVADVRAPWTTGSLAIAAVGLAWRSGSSLDIILLGGDQDNPPRTWLEARELFNISGDLELLDIAEEKAREIGLELAFIPVGESTHRDDLVLDAVRDGGYDLVLDDLRPIDVGPRMGRLKRVHKQLVGGDTVDTAYRLLRDAPCDVAIVVDAVRMNLIPASYVKVGAVAALSLGVLGAAGIAAAPSAAASEYTATVEAPAVTEAEAEAPEEATETAEAETVAPETAPVEAPAPVGTPPPAVETLPEEVTPEQIAAGEQAMAQEQATLSGEQAELAALQQQAAEAEQAVALAETDLALEQNEVYEAQETAESAEAALEYAEGARDDLSESDESQALGSYNRAVDDVEEQQADVAEAEAALAAVQADAEATAAALAAQQSVVQAQSTNVAQWSAVLAEADARTDQVVSPCPGYSISTHYGVAGSNWSSGHHTGTDFAAPAGTSIVAVADGVVIQTGWNGPYGNQTVIEHEDGTVTTYSHQNEILVEVGQEVEAGQEIGTVGSTGNSTGPHLHFEVHDAAGNTLDSDDWLMENGAV